MIYVLASIVATCAFFGFVELLVWIWDKLDPPAEIKEVRIERDHRKTA